MPRAGSGGGSHHSSGGHHSSSHSSGGHHVSSSHSGAGSHSRAGSGSFHPTGHPSGPSHNPGPRPGMGPGMGFGGPMTPPPPRAPRHRHFGYRRTYGSSGGGCLSNIIAFFIIVAVLIVLAGSCSASNSNEGYTSDKAAVSTVSREKLTASGSFDNNCIVDELDWFENTKSAGKALKTFYDKTGVQPYVVLLSYDSALTSDDDKEEYANTYYDENIADEDSFLFVYFAEQDQDNDVGYMCYVCGNNARTVMDSEAVDIFWDYIDSYWYSDMSTDELFETVFTKTANSIMGTASSDSSSGLGKTFRNILIIAIVIIAAVIIAKRINKKSDNKDADAAKDNPNILN